MAVIGAPLLGCQILSWDLVVLVTATLLQLSEDGPELGSVAEAPRVWRLTATFGWKTELLKTRGRYTPQKPTAHNYGPLAFQRGIGGRLGAGYPVICSSHLMLDDLQTASV